MGDAATTLCHREPPASLVVYSLECCSLDSPPAFLAAFPLASPGLTTSQMLPVLH
eukprot:m.290886 g.290886  ORF g.290886 m.290886 type:complete len:55 (+) comp12373_c0_seq1:2540-2704(+)